MVRKISKATKQKFFKKLDEKVIKDTKRMVKLAGSKKTRNFLKNLRKKCLDCGQNMYENISPNCKTICNDCYDNQTKEKGVKK